MPRESGHIGVGRVFSPCVGCFVFFLPCEVRDMVIRFLQGEDKGVMRSGCVDAG